MALPPKRLLSAQETAEYLGISLRTLYNRTGRKSKDKFPVQPKKIGRLLKFDIRDLEKYIDSL